MKKEEMTKAIKETKDSINSLLTSESTKEQIDLISKVSKSIDELNDKISSVFTENEDLKESLINYIKTGGDNKPPQDITQEGETKTFEQCILDLAKNKK